MAPAAITSLSSPDGQGMVEAYSQCYPTIVEPPLTLINVKEHYIEMIESSHHFRDIYPPERQRDFSRASYVSDGARPMTPEAMKSSSPPDKQRFHPIYPLAYRKLLMVSLSQLTCGTKISNITF